MFNFQIKKIFFSCGITALCLSFTMGAYAGNYQNQNPSSYYQYQTNGSYYQYQGQGPASSYVADVSDPSDDNTDENSSVSDQELTKKIHDKLSSGLFSQGYNQVNIQVNNGNVTLQGTVKTWDDKRKIEKEIRNLDGVKSLSSEIQVQESSSKESPRAFSQDTYATSTDDQLNKKIRDKVSRGWIWDSYKGVTLNTSNGVVTLEGTVDSISDQQKLATEIQKIDGVKSVKSNLKIKNR
jgi:osmotically-inducible protein OsmY